MSTKLKLRKHQFASRPMQREVMPFSPAHSTIEAPPIIHSQLEESAQPARALPEFAPVEGEPNILHRDRLAFLCWTSCGLFLAILLLNDVLGGLLSR